jgi:hypothetical protein
MDIMFLIIFYLTLSFIAGSIIIHRNIIIPDLENTTFLEKWIIGPHNFIALIRYKNMCKQKGKSLIWYRIQISLQFIILLMIFVTFFILSN